MCGSFQRPHCRLHLYNSPAQAWYFNHHDPPYELFFSSRIELYLDLLDRLPLPTPWILSLPQVDLEFTVPCIGQGCPICANTYLPNFLDEIPPSDEGRQKDAPTPSMRTPSLRRVHLPSGIGGRRNRLRPLPRLRLG